MKILKINIEKIKEYENNAKEHPQQQIKQIKDSILQFGFNDPIAIDENNVVIEGHGRLKALKELGFDEVEVIKLEHLSEVQKKSYILSHNKINLNTNFDKNILKKEIEEICKMSEEVEILGFYSEEIKEILEDEVEVIKEKKVKVVENELEENNHRRISFDVESSVVEKIDRIEGKTRCDKINYILKKFFGGQEC